MMAEKVREVMTREPLTMRPEETLTAAARQMRDADVGVVIVADGTELRGVLTDRDITVRAVAEGLDPHTTSLADVVTDDLVAVAAGDSIDTAVRLMRTYAVRRLPVLDGGRLVGVVSLGDLAVERDTGSALADVSAEEPTN